MSHESEPSESLSAADRVSIPVGPHTQTLAEGTGPGSHDHTTFYEQMRTITATPNPLFGLPWDARGGDRG